MARPLDSLGKVQDGLSLHLTGRTFESAYSRELIDCGRKDVEARLDELVALLRADGI